MYCTSTRSSHENDCCTKYPNLRYVHSYICNTTPKHNSLCRCWLRAECMYVVTSPNPATSKLPGGRSTAVAQPRTTNREPKEGNRSAAESFSKSRVGVQAANQPALVARARQALTTTSFNLKRKLDRHPQQLLTCINQIKITATPRTF